MSAKTREHLGPLPLLNGSKEVALNYVVVALSGVLTGAAFGDYIVVSNHLGLQATLEHPSQYSPSQVETAKKAYEDAQTALRRRDSSSFDQIDLEHGVGRSLHILNTEEARAFKVSQHMTANRDLRYYKDEIGYFLGGIVAVLSASNLFVNKVYHLAKAIRRPKSQLLQQST